MPRRGALISHAGRVNTAIHQVQEENNRAEAVRDTSPSAPAPPPPPHPPNTHARTAPAIAKKNPCLSLASFLKREGTQEQIQDKREQINFLAEKCSDDVGHIRVIYTHWTRGEMKTRNRGKEAERDEGFYSHTLACARGTFLPCARACTLLRTHRLSP